jgi:hypothetical protein
MVDSVIARQPCERRELLTFSMRSFAAVVMALPAIAQQAEDDAGSRGTPGLDWDRFLSKVESAARVQYTAARRSEISYVTEIERLGRGLKLTDLKLSRILKSASLTDDLHPAFKNLDAPMSFQATLITFKAGQSLPFHDHPRMTGVMTSIVGRTDVRSLQLISNERPGLFMLRDEGVVRMRPGMVSSLTSNVRNIHGLEARSFSQIIDIFTPPYDPARIQESRLFQIMQSDSASRTVIARLLKHP